MKGDLEKLEEALSPVVREISQHILNPSDEDKKEMVDRGLIADEDDSPASFTLAFLMEGCKVTLTVEQETLTITEGV